MNRADLNLARTKVNMDLKKSIITEIGEDFLAVEPGVCKGDSRRENRLTKPVSVGKEVNSMLKLLRFR